MRLIAGRSQIRSVMNRRQTKFTWRINHTGNLDATTILNDLKILSKDRVLRKTLSPGDIAFIFDARCDLKEYKEDVETVPHRRCKNVTRVLKETFEPMFCDNLDVSDLYNKAL